MSITIRSSSHIVFTEKYKEKINVATTPFGKLEVTANCVGP